MVELFPYLTERQIKTCLLKLEEFGYIGKNCFNENPYDRTNWYCDLRQKQRLNNVQSTGQKSPTERTEMSNRADRNVQSITDSKPDSKPDKKQKNNKKNSFVKPSLSDVVAFLKERGFNDLYAKKIYEHYELGDWKDAGGRQVINWKQKINTNWINDSVKEIYRIKESNLFNTGESTISSGIKMIY